MAKYKITSEDNSITSPFVISSTGAGADTVTEINCNNKFVSLGQLTGCTELESFIFGKITDTNCSSIFQNCSKLKKVRIAFANNIKNTNAMFQGCSSLIEVRPATFGSFATINNISQMFFKCAGLTSFTNDLSNVQTANGAFQDCTALTEFNAVLPLLSSADNLFYNCSSLVNFPTSYPELTRGEQMFMYCHGLVDVNFNMPKLNYSVRMFMGCNNLKTFTGDLTKITSSANCQNMFFGCDKLERVTVTVTADNIDLIDKTVLGLKDSCTLVKTIAGDSDYRGEVEE